jgi:minor extracellular serine protease Vpr
MKLLQLAFVFLLSCTFAKAQVTQKPKLSASTQLYLWKQQKYGVKKIFEENVYMLDNAGEAYAKALIKVAEGFDGENLKMLGANISTKAGTIWSVQIPLSKMNEFANTIGVLYIEMDQPTAPALDTARHLTKVDLVHEGIGLPQPYTGNNVVVGVVDAGFDYTHPTMYDTAYVNYRVKRVWEEKNSTGTSPTGFGYGSEYTDSLSIVTKGQDILDGIHGTHVTGIAAGSGSGGAGGNNSRYRGMAYSSDIVLVGIYPTASYWLNTGMTDMLDGINYVFNYAASVGKPAVCNLSWGCPLGPRDGSSLFSQALDALTGPGKIFVLSAGNNGQDKIHLRKTFTTTSTSVETICNFSSYLTEKKNWLDIWGDTGKTFCMNFSLYSGLTKLDSSITVCLDDAVHSFYLIGTSDTCFVTVTTVTSEFNMKPHMLVEITNHATVNKLTVKISGSDGTVDMWQGYVLKTSGYVGSFTKSPYTWMVNGDVNYATSDLTSSHNAIPIGAYNSKTSFVNVSGSTQTYTGYTKGALALFSSHGPTADGRVVPFITGPGLALASSINHTDTTYHAGEANYSDVVSEYISPLNGNTYAYAMAAGTSMSGPCVSGIVGLLLEINPALDPDGIKSILQLSAITDSYTGTIPAGGSNTWGYGKVDAYQAVLQALGIAGIYHEENTGLNAMLFPNPGNGAYAIDLMSGENGKLVVNCYAATGAQVLNTSWNVVKGINKYALNISEQPAGIYFVKLTGSKGAMTVKLVKE